MKFNMKIEEIRLADLQTLVSDMGTLVAVSQSCGASSAYLSQILTRSKMTSGKVRDVGSNLARKPEKGCGKPEGWMSVTTTSPPAKVN